MRSGISPYTKGAVFTLGGPQSDKIKGLVMYHKSDFEADLTAHWEDYISGTVSDRIVQSLLR